MKRNIKQIASFIVLLMLMITAIILQKNGIISDNILSSVIFLLAVSSTLVGLFFSHKKKFKEIEIHFCRFNEFLQSESLSCSLANPPDEGKVCRKGRGIWCRHDLESDHDGVFNSRNRVTTVPDNRDSGHRIRHVPRMIILDDVRKPLPPRRLDVPGTTPAPWCLRRPDRLVPLG